MCALSSGAMLTSTMSLWSSGDSDWPGVHRSLSQSHRGVREPQRGESQRGVGGNHREVGESQWVTSVLCWEESDVQGGVSSVSLWDTLKHYSPWVGKDRLVCWFEKPGVC